MNLQQCCMRRRRNCLYQVTSNGILSYLVMHGPQGSSEAIAQIGNLSMINGIGGISVQFLALVRPFSVKFSLLRSRSFLSNFLLLCNYSCVCFFLLFRSCCSHARCILCGIPVIHTAWSLVFQSSATKDCSKPLIYFYRVCRRGNCDLFHCLAALATLEFACESVYNHNYILYSPN